MTLHIAQSVQVSGYYNSDQRVQIVLENGKTYYALQGGFPALRPFDLDPSSHDEILLSWLKRLRDDHFPDAKSRERALAGWKDKPHGMPLAFIKSIVVGDPLVVCSPFDDIHASEPLKHKISGNYTIREITIIPSRMMVPTEFRTA